MCTVLRTYTCTGSPPPTQQTDVASPTTTSTSMSFFQLFNTLQMAVVDNNGNAVHSLVRTTSPSKSTSCR